MSSVTLQVQLTYKSAEHAKLVFEAFSQWPTMTVRKKRPDARRMQAIKCSMIHFGKISVTWKENMNNQRSS